MKYWVIALVVVAAIGGAFYYLGHNLDSIVAAQIESVGSQTLGTKVRVGSVELDLRAGSGTVRGLRVENPNGFSGDRLFSLGEISLAIDVKSALAVASGSSEHIVIKRLQVKDPEVSVITNDRGQTNLEVVQQHIARSGSAASSGGSPLRISIQELSVSSGKIEADTTAISGKRYDLPLPGFRMRGVGGSKGASPAVVAEAIGGVFATRVAAVVAARAVGQGLRKVIDSKLGGQAGEAAQGLLNQFLGSP